MNVPQGRPAGPGALRMVTHLDISAADIDRAGAVIKGFFRLDQC